MISQINTTTEKLNPIARTTNAPVMCFNESLLFFDFVVSLENFSLAKSVFWHWGSSGRWCATQSLINPKAFIERILHYINIQLCLSYNVYIKWLLYRRWIMNRSNCYLSIEQNKLKTQDVPAIDWFQNWARFGCEECHGNRQTVLSNHSKFTFFGRFIRVRHGVKSSKFGLKICILFRFLYYTWLNW